MQLLVHYKTKQVENFLSQLSSLNRNHRNKSFHFSKHFYAFVDELVDYFRQIGDSINLSEVEQIRNYYQMSEEGIDPETLQKVHSHRRVLTRKSAFHCLSKLTNLLQEELQKDQAKLEQAKSTIGQLILSLIQAEVIDPQHLSSDLDQNQIKNFWNRLNQNEQVKLHERNLRLSITKDDIYLVFGDVLQNLQN